MLYLKLQKIKEATKTEEFQKEVGGKATWIKIIMKDKKVWRKQSLNKNLFTDIWFSFFNILD